MKVEMRVKVSGKGSKYKKEQQKKIPRAIEKRQRDYRLKYIFRRCYSESKSCAIHRNVRNLVKYCIHI